jgi:hypothetical protein
MTEPPDRPAGQWTPAELGVHQAIGGGPLSAYARRPHDERLRAVLDPATEYSRLVVIRGNALTGTSRTVYEAVTDVLADWMVEHPPTVAALAARLQAGIPPRTVLWLGELRHYADADGGAAILDHLNDLLDDDGRVVAIATIWPGYWDSYTAAAAAGLGAADPAAVVGRLLAGLDVLAEYDLTSHDPAYGGVVDVPDRFTPEEMAAAAEGGDPALAAAAAARPDGQVIQYLAGARDLLARYDGPGTDPYGQAIITAAMDASRLGHAGPLPAALLRDAAPGYLADLDRTVGYVGEWDTALAWATDSGWALQPVPPTAAGNGTPDTRWPATSTSAAAEPGPTNRARPPSGTPWPRTLGAPTIWVVSPRPRRTADYTVTPRRCGQLRPLRAARTPQRGSLPTSARWPNQPKPAAPPAGPSARPASTIRGMWPGCSRDCVRPGRVMRSGPYWLAIQPAGRASGTNGTSLICCGRCARPGPPRRPALWSSGSPGRSA